MWSFFRIEVIVQINSAKLSWASAMEIPNKAGREGKLMRIVPIYKITNSEFLMPRLNTLT